MSYDRALTRTTARATSRRPPRSSAAARTSAEEMYVAPKREHDFYELAKRIDEARAWLRL